MRTFGLLLLCTFVIPGAFAPSTCGNVQLQLTPDYSFAIGNSSGGSTYTFTLGGASSIQKIYTLRVVEYFGQVHGAPAVKTEGTAECVEGV